MTQQNPTVVLVHGAFAESASWSGVIEQLQHRSLDVVAVANPLRSVPGDAAYVRDVIACHHPAEQPFRSHLVGQRGILQAEMPDITGRKIPVWPTK